MTKREIAAARWQTLTQLLNYPLMVVFSAIFTISIFVGFVQAVKLATNQSQSGSIDFFTLSSTGLAAFWYMFWHVGLIMIVVCVLVAVIILSVMSSVMSNAELSIQNEGYLGFDEPNSPSTPSGDFEERRD